ncbi:aldo/keto reductase [Paenibacillus apii]|nr:aldo/keto reductase [Paenibacillus apii]
MSEFDSVHPLTAVQSEYSLMARAVENTILPTLQELGIGFVAYSPLSRGLLTGRLNQDDLDQEGVFGFKLKYKKSNFSVL